MPKRSWTITGRNGTRIKIRKRRSVESDYPIFHSPKVIWNKINRKQWEYRTNYSFLHLRDLAFMSLLYLTTSRVSELCRFKKVFKKVSGEHIEVAPSITKDQFREEGDFLWLGGLRIIKRRFKKVGGAYMELESVEDYPSRSLISFPLKGELNIFTTPVTELLSKIRPKDELFKFRNCRGYQIVNYCTVGEFPHYLRDMGLKLRLRLYGMNLGLLKEFSGHERMENLARYLREKETEEARQRMLAIKLEEFEPKRM